MNLRLPDRTTTDNVERFGLEWNAIIEPLEEKYDLIVSGFDPGFTVYDKLQPPYSTSIHIPMWLALRMIK